MGVGQVKTLDNYDLSDLKRKIVVVSRGII